MAKTKTGAAEVQVQDFEADAEFMREVERIKRMKVLRKVYNRERAKRPEVIESRRAYAAARRIRMQEVMRKAKEMGLLD
jgi:hypothetical protein